MQKWKKEITCKQKNLLQKKKTFENKNKTAQISPSKISDIKIFAHKNFHGIEIFPTQKNLSV
jgi:hypothetical protein